MGFNKDLAKGKAGEDLAIELFESHGFKCEPVSKELRRFYDFTVLVGGKEYQVEVKYDLRSLQTGNIALEVGNPKTGKDTGVMGTKAHLWVHILSSQSIWVARTEFLREYISTGCPFGLVKEVVGGDANASLVILKTDIILPLLFTEVSTIPTTEFKNLLENLIC